MKLNLKGKIIVTVVTVLGLVLWFTYRYLGWYETNKACHEKCKAQGYAAGEDELLYEHTICVCFAKKPDESNRFLLEASDRLEDGK
jgi:hypothetical protein